MRSQKIWLSTPHMGGTEMKYITEAFESNWISPVGPNITAFENELASYNGVGYCAALSSGTAAIHLALIILGIHRGDEVICSTFTFSGSCNPIAYLGATPVFVDSERDTWNMDPELLELAIKDRIAKTGRRPKAVILVHLYGMPAKLKEIIAITTKYEIPLVEDAAEAIGSTYQDKKLGSFGDLGIYSFNGNKIITTSGGGALVSSKEEWIQKARFLATQAREPAPHYQHEEIGYNYRLSNICAGIGRGQLQVLDERVRQRRSNFQYYKQTLEGITGISFTQEMLYAYSNRWLTTILIDPRKVGVSREDIRCGLQDENIETRPLWKPMHLQPVFEDAPAYTSGVSEELFDQGLCLPSGSSLSAEELRSVTDSIISIVRSSTLRHV